MSKATLEIYLERLASADRKELGQLWNETFDRAMPKGWSRPMLRRTIAAEQQSRVLASLTKAELRTLTSALPHSRDDQLTDGDHEQPVKKASTDLKPGTRLVREWRGRTYEVLVLEGGKAKLGQETYRSLSAVATAITGTRWSGPLFFGLRDRKKQAEQTELALER